MKKLTLLVASLVGISSVAQNRKSDPEVRKAVNTANAAAGHGTSKVGEQDGKKTPATATSTNKSKGEMPAEGPQPTPAVPYGSQPVQVEE